MDLFDYSYYESGSFIDSAPPDFRVQRTPCGGATLNALLVAAERLSAAKHLPVNKSFIIKLVFTSYVIFNF